MSTKGPFLYWSENGTGPNAWIQILKDHYTYLAATYLLKGMKRESELLMKVAEEFAQIQNEAAQSNSKKFLKDD